MANLCINFLSLNVRGIRDLAKRKSRIISWAEKKKADIIFLQETYSTADGNTNGQVICFILMALITVKAF